jgi:hypothetical protein
MTKARVIENHTSHSRASRASIHKRWVAPHHPPRLPEAALLGERLDVAVTLVVHSLSSREFQAHQTAVY